MNNKSQGVITLPTIPPIIIHVNWETRHNELSIFRELGVCQLGMSPPMEGNQQSDKIGVSELVEDQLTEKRMS